MIIYKYLQARKSKVIFYLAKSDKQINGGAETILGCYSPP
jgi:hypothetical protein